jgi:hypothetical protein
VEIMMIAATVPIIESVPSTTQTSLGHRLPLGQP